MRTRFCQYYVVRTHEPASFWWEKVIATIIVLRVIKCCTHFIILQSGEGLNSFKKINRAITQGLE